MTYFIGIGILFDTAVTNDLREIELRLASVTGNLNGLRQPPHITIKRPFEIESESIEHVTEDLKRLLGNYKPFLVSLQGVDSFGTSVLYANVERNDMLTLLHKDLVSAFAKYQTAPDPLEGDNVVFHSTLAAGLSTPECTKALDMLEDEHGISISTTANEVGLFLGLDQGKYWSVIKTFTL